MSIAMRYLFTICFGLTFVFWAKAQQLTMSPEISLKNERAYFIIGELENNVIVIKDRESSQDMEIFNKRFEPVQDLELNLSENRARVVEAFGYLGYMYVVFQKKEKKKHTVNIHKYTEYGRLVDSLMIIGIEDMFIPPNFEAIRSQDGGKLGVYTQQSEKKSFLGIFDLKKFELSYADKLTNESVSSKSESYKVLLADDGTCFIISSRSINFSRKKQFFDLVRIDAVTDEFYSKELLLEDILITDIDYFLSADQQKLQIFGFSSEKHADRSEFYFIASLSPSLELEYFIEKPFDLGLLRSVYGQQKKLKKTIGDLKIRDVLYNTEGGMRFFAETYRSYSRRPSFPTATGGHTGTGIW